MEIRRPKTEKIPSLSLDRGALTNKFMST